MPDSLANISPELANFLDYATVERGLAPNSIVSYRRDLQKFAAFLLQSKLALDEVQHQHIRKFLATLYGQGLSSRSAARNLAAIRHFFQFLVKEGRIAVDP